jgi:hypothetical protein
MKKILFFTQDRWAFGSIHHGLVKELYKRGIYANLLSWSNSYSLDEFDYFNRTYDLFVTNPDAVLALHEYKIPLKKISTVAHGQWDILLAKQNATFDFYPELHSFGCISNVLVEKCKEWGFYTLPRVVELGIHFDLFYRKPSSTLKNIGYMASHEVKNFFGQEIKRGRLFDDISRACTSLNFKKHNFYHHLATPAVYSDLDAVIMTSSEEAGGLPMMECAAAGRLPIGTPVGYFEHNASKGGGILAPLEEKAFVEFTTHVLTFYQNNPEIYTDACFYFQQFARDNYDWSSKIDNWMALFE